MTHHRTRAFALAGALALLLALAPSVSQARIGGGGSFGSRGSRTYSAPAPTPFNPGGASSIRRSMTPHYGTAPSYNGYGYNRGSPFGRGLLGGLLGAGLFGLFFGHGFFGGFGGAGSILGFLIQIALLVFLFRWAMRAFAGAQPGLAGGFFSGRSRGWPSFGSAGFQGSGQGTAAGQPITLEGQDLNAFEWLLQESQTAFGAEDLDRLRAVSTPEMASYFAEQLAQNARRGMVNKIADVRLLKGESSESWREPSGEYATVAMRFSLLDWTVDRQSGQLVEGDPRSPQEASEFWTFRRDPGTGPSGWRISAIQQAQS